VDQEVREATVTADGSVLQAISNEMVRLFKEQFGRGPTRARTNWAGPDVLVVVLEETLTPAERNLVQMGEHERLRETRMFFQYATVRELCEPVERLTGRKVRAFCSAIDTEVEGMCVETFVLHPRGSDAPSRIEKAGQHL
jgi:uncharacterized protein YbcI